MTDQRHMQAARTPPTVVADLKRLLLGITEIFASHGIEYRLCPLG